MECRVAWRGHSVGGGVWHHLPGVVFPERQQLGTVGSDSLSVRYVGLVCGVDPLPLDETSFEVEGAVAEVGPCSHLLAHRRFVFASDAGGLAYTGLLGLGVVCVRVDLCHRGNDYQFRSSEGALECGDLLFHRHGTECACSLQAAVGFCIGYSGQLDHRRRGLLYHGCRLLQSKQNQIYALSIPFLCAGRFCVSHHRSVGCVDGLSIKVKR